MADFAEIKSSDNIVFRVVVINDEDIAGKTEAEAEAWVAANIVNQPGIDPYPSTYWKQTWLDGSQRYNGAGEGMFFDSTANAFYWKDGPFASWTLNTSTYKWEAPSAHPGDDNINSNEIVSWNEDDTRWQKKTDTDLNDTHYWNGSSWVEII